MICAIVQAYLVLFLTTFAAGLTNGTTTNFTTLCQVSATPIQEFADGPAEETPAPRPSSRRCSLTFWPTNLTVVRSDNSSSPYVPDRHNLFLAIRQNNETRQYATEVQFTGITASKDTCCNLKLQLPTKGHEMYGGPQPILSIYQVARAPGNIATWNSYEPANLSLHKPLHVGEVNGSAWEQYRIFKYFNGYYDAASVPCNETLTFQIGMAHEGGELLVNSWQFVNTNPPLTPVQGFKIWAGDKWCYGL